ncbi:aminopeptidase P family protein [Prevotella sp. E13-17]|uniref:aminopeptidase P family protein n=1 Tax=Prevotella sp. E13-17 TaxID=2913616 RepID=UPI001EDA54C9|nr:aminopeptidase P family protein [Prevotella sp. E13-17]UKK51339.1 aminopeptidase P family protein [Prevotella sp. E13-17]
MIAERLTALRELMRREHLSAFIFPSTDPHQGEYVPDHWKGREWISGFDGSAGTAVVTLHSAALWTDSRYFIAAAEQLKDTEYQLMKLKMPGTPTIAEWLGQELKTVRSAEVGIDGMVSSARVVRDLIGELRLQGGITLRTNLDPLKQIWRERPVIPENKIELQPLKYAGESARDKVARIRKALRRQHANGMLMASLDDIAWTLNLRGTDVHCTPVFVAYLLVSSVDVTLFVSPAKLTDEVKAYLAEEGVMLRDYEEIADGLKHYFEYNILMDPDEVNYTLSQMVTRKVVEAESPVKRMKTVKNEVEMEGFHHAMLRDGVAMVKFLKWLSEYPDVTKLTELTIDEKLTALRAEQPLYRDLSFDTIAGYADHGAIVHYEATPETATHLKPEGLLLLDSGAQYQDGTTDITRTIALGPLTDEERKVYTLVLKGHIALSRAVFPEGTSGTQLDVLARQFMWREGLNYLHGTGHGVGSYLSVHEGPHQFRMEWKPAPLVAGMTITDEPGLYLEGKFGVRIENTLLVVPAMETAFGRYLQFEPLTLCPIDKRLIMMEMLTDEERQWLNDYHALVYERLSPCLNQEENDWLRAQTSKI